MYISHYHHMMKQNPETHVEIWFKRKIRSENVSFAKCTTRLLPTLFDR